MKVFSLALVIAASSALGAGYALPEQSARQLGKGGTGVASATGASAVYDNPARLGFEDGLSAELGGIAIAPSFNYRNPATNERVSAEGALFLKPSVFVAAPVAEDVFVGLGAFSSYGLGIRWPDFFPGRFDALAANLQTFTVNPSAAYRLNDAVSVSAGLSLHRATLELTQRLSFPDSEGSVRMGGGTFALGGNAAVALSLLRGRLLFGASLRTGSPLSFEGRADFQNVPRELEGDLRDQAVRTTLPLPMTATVGGSYALIEPLRVDLDVTYTGWSSLRTLSLDFEVDALDQNLRRDWVDTFTARVGVEYAATKRLSLRLGAGFDQTPSPPDTLAPSLPDGSRIIGSAGAQYRLGNFYVDGGYLFVTIPERATTGEAFPAIYGGSAYLVALSVGFRQ